MSEGGAPAAADAAERPSPLEGWRVQRRVIGALILREIHIRFGRQNLGYLWLFAEPLLLGTAISLIHLVKDTGHSRTGTLSIFAFFAIGYSLYYMFRAVVGRAAGGMAGSKPLLYHRVVAPIDIIYARHALEGAACALVVTVTSFGVAAVEDLVPAEPVKMVAAMVLMLWLCHGLALIVAAASERAELVERLVHPMIYLQLPISGAFFLVDWLPPEYRQWVLYNPTVHIFELLRDGQFGDQVRTTYEVSYVIACAAVLQLLGLCAIRSVRRHMEME